MESVNSTVIRSLEDSAYSLRVPDDFDPLLDQIGDASLVLIGEASHGTSDFYTWRARLSKRLIQEKGFSFVAVEGDWPDCYRVNRYAKGYLDSGTNSREILQVFARWPTWMWANWEIVAFVTWLRAYNETLAAGERVGFYGLDVYSLWESMEAVIDFLQDADPDAVEAARRAYMCFEPYGQDVQQYAWSTAMVPSSCESEVVDLLTELRRNMPVYPDDTEAKFSAEQNAQVMVNAERYYRAMVRSDSSSWNIRDQHMVEVLNRLMAFHGSDAKAIVWEHNTHIGDARATNMTARGEVNVGQLVREQYGTSDVVLVGFASYRGSVIAGREWGDPMRRMTVPQAREDSWESLLHSISPADRVLLLATTRQNNEMLQPRGHRAIGVVYRPQYDLLGNYIPTVLPQRYDALIYLDQTEALHPLHLAPHDTGTPPDTYPWGV